MFTVRSMSLGGVAAALAALGTWRAGSKDGDPPSSSTPRPEAVSKASQLSHPQGVVPAGDAAVMESKSYHPMKHLKKKLG